MKEEKKKKKKKKPKALVLSPAQRLEQTLRIWEDRMLLDELILKTVQIIPVSEEEIRGMKPEERPLDLEFANEVYEGLSQERRTCIRQWLSVRDRLLRAVTDFPPEVPLRRKALEKEGDLMGIDAFLWGVLGWCRSSRRMYQVPGDLQLLLQATSIRDLLGDMNLPFESFMLLLDEPLQDGNGACYDAILFHRYGPEKYPSFVIGLFRESYGRYKPLPGSLREMGMNALARKDVLSPLTMERKWRRQLPPEPLMFSFETISPEEESEDGALEEERLEEDGKVAYKLKDMQAATILTSFEKLMSKEASGKMILLALRLVYGFGRYLLTLPREEQEGRSAPISPPAFHTPKCITNGGQVCLVQSQYTLTRRERDLFREYGKGKELVSAHFREGYYSRPRGLGHDPTAEKTVWHKPTIVRRDLLQEGTLPYGREAVLKPPPQQPS